MWSVWLDALPAGIFRQYTLGSLISCREDPSFLFCVFFWSKKTLFMWPCRFFWENSPAAPRRTLPHASKHWQNILTGGCRENPLEWQRRPLGLRQWRWSGMDQNLTGEWRPPSVTIFSRQLQSNHLNMVFGAAEVKITWRTAKESVELFWGNLLDVTVFTQTLMWWGFLF